METYEHIKKNRLLKPDSPYLRCFSGREISFFLLALGQYALDQTPWALLGLLLTAVAMPFAGLLAMFRYRGQIRLFFGRLGQNPRLALSHFNYCSSGSFWSCPSLHY